MARWNRARKASLRGGFHFRRNSLIVKIAFGKIVRLNHHSESKNEIGEYLQVLAGDDLSLIPLRVIPVPLPLATACCSVSRKHLFLMPNTVYWQNALRQAFTRINDSLRTFLKKRPSLSSLSPPPGLSKAISKVKSSVCWHHEPSGSGAGVHSVIIVVALPDQA